MTVIALPGFTRGPKHLARLADACSQSGLPCVRPALAPRWMPILYMRRGHLDGLAARLAGQLTSPVVIAGHSAGAAAGCYLATSLMNRDVDVAGVVLIDGVDSPNHLIRETLPQLRELRVGAVLAPASPCNRQGALAQFLSGYPWVRSTFVEGAGHGDIEGAGIGVYRRACKDTSDQATADRFLQAVMEMITWCADPLSPR